MAIYGTASDGVTNSLFDVDDRLVVGNAGQGQLYVGRQLDGTEVGSGSLQVDGNLQIGLAVANHLDNRVVVSGTDAMANIDGSLTIGENGTGTFQALNGAHITVQNGVNVSLLGGSVGDLLLDGAGTTLEANNLFAGNGSGSGSTATMTVSGGARATFDGSFGNSNDAITLGDDDEGVGTLNVTGANSIAETTVSGWFIGGSGNEPGGTGTVNISAGGQGTSTGRVVIGHGSNANGTLNVDGQGSVFNANGDFILTGFEGVGTANITNGGQVHANGILIADQPGSAGSQINVDGGTLTTNRRLYVGDSARGIMEVSGGAQVDVALNPGTAVADKRLIIGDEGAADGSRLTLTGQGTRLDYHSDDRISVGLSGGSTTNRATLEVLDGAVLQAVQRDAQQNIVSQGWITLGDENGGNGQINLDGAGSQIEARYLNVGEQTSASGIVNIVNGGQFTLTEFVEIGAAGNGVNTMSVSGSGSRLDVGGDLSIAAGSSSLRVDGVLTITDGAAVSNGDEGYIARASTNVGVVNVGGTGAAASWDVGTDLFVAGNNNLSVSGSMTSGSATLNVNANGQVTVGETLVLKDRGTINLLGGELRANDFLFQDFPERALSPTVNFDQGTLAYTNPAGKSLTNFDLDRIFDGGPQVLRSGQRLEIAGTTVLDNPTANTPLVRINGGALSVGSISKTDFEKIDFDAGTFELTNSNLFVQSAGLFGSIMVLDSQQTVNIVGGSATVAAGSSLNVIGGGFSSTSATNNGLIIISQTNTVDFDADNTGGGLTNEGRLLLVDSMVSGSVTNHGDIQIVGTSGVGGLTMAPTSSLEFGLASDSEFDTLFVDGAAALAGELVVGLLGDFAPMLGDSFDLLSATGGLAGTFDSLSLPTLDAGLLWEVTYGLQTATLNVTSSVLPGDFNGDGIYNCTDVDALVAEIAGGLNASGFDLTGDGVVNTDDLNDWLAIAGAENLASGNAYLAGDANLDGVVDGQDFVTWNSNKFTSNAAWCAGDYNADGTVDGQDFVAWNANKFTAADNFSAVPEPGTGLTTLFVAFLFALCQRNRKTR